MNDKPLRSVLYVPGSNQKALDKARTLPCDAVIIDLEDAVAPDQKEAARAAAAAAVQAGGWGDRTVVVRINGLDTEWYPDDVAALKPKLPDAVLVPKLAAAGDLMNLQVALGIWDPNRQGAPMPTQFWAMIETCRSVLNLGEIASGAGLYGLTTLVAGTNDLAKDMRCTPGADRMPLIPHLVAMVTQARANFLTVLDGVCNAIDDQAVLTAECAQGAALGFDGKTLIHPAQIAAANAAFSPSPAAVARAQAIVDAFALPENADKGAIRVNGEMVELLHLAEARRVLARAAV